MAWWAERADAIAWPVSFNLTYIHWSLIIEVDGFMIRIDSRDQIKTRHISINFTLFKYEKTENSSTLN